MSLFYLQIGSYRFDVVFALTRRRRMLSVWYDAHSFDNYVMLENDKPKCTLEMNLSAQRFSDTYANQRLQFIEFQWKQIVIVWQIAGGGGCTQIVTGRKLHFCRFEALFPLILVLDIGIHG